jgi:leucine dehydrogenase
MVLREMRTDGHEHITYVRDEEAGLEAIVAVHDTTLGPALGGTRILDYPSEGAALTDVLRLSRAMTYKAAAADLDLGGGKAVILGDPGAVKDDALFRAYGRAVDNLGGTYITTEDMNTEVEDMDVVAEETGYVVGTNEGLGDPSPVTAHGVAHGIRASLAWRDGDSSLEDVTVLVQGAGKVGAPLAEMLAEDGATVKIADPNPEAGEAVKEAADGEVSVVDPADALTEPCDVFAPCAISHLGLGDADDLRDVIPDLACDIIAGSANNALGDHEEASDLAAILDEHGILYAPDYVINAGGLILTYHDWIDSDRESAYEDAERIGDRLTTIFERAQSEGITTLAAANRYAEERFA